MVLKFTWVVGTIASVALLRAASRAYFRSALLFRCFRGPAYPKESPVVPDAAETYGMDISLAVSPTFSPASVLQHTGCSGCYSCMIDGAS